MGTIEVDGLTKVYADDLVAVQDLSFTVGEGEIFGFLGPNGAGKSTTINILLDFIRPTSGSVSVFGMDAQEHPTTIRERVGVLPEGYDVYPPLTGLEHVAMAVETKDVDDDPRAILETVGLGGEGERAAGSYSKGMKQRLALGFALVGDPDLLILDEPSSGLDPNGIQLMRSLVRERAADGTTVFFSSHHLSQVESVCDRVGIMNDGRLVATDTIDALSERVGGYQQLRLECESPPPTEDIAAFAGVVDVRTDESTVIVECSAPARKADVVETVAEHTHIQNLFAPDDHLEALFNDLTDGSARGESTETAAASVAQEK